MTINLDKDQLKQLEAIAQSVIAQMQSFESAIRDLTAQLQKAK